MRVSLAITGERPALAQSQFSSRKPEPELYTVADINGEMDSHTLANTLRAIADGIES